MPELPEVESFRKYIEDHALHQQIQSVKTSMPTQMLVDTSKRKLREVLEGNTLVDTFRHGKFLFIALKLHGSLMLHFGMTGDLMYLKEGKAEHPFVLGLHFHNGHTLVFSDSRMLGKIALVEDVDKFIQRKGYGPDALLVLEDVFLKLLSKRKTAIKAALMNQKIIAGVGNEFSDAILFQCRIHPLSSVNALKKEQLEEIYHMMKGILKEAVKVNADREKLNHYFLLNERKAGLTCVRCKGKTEWLTIGGRSSYFCPSCQELLFIQKYSTFFI